MRWVHRYLFELARDKQEKAKRIDDQPELAEQLEADRAIFRPGVA